MAHFELAEMSASSSEIVNNLKDKLSPSSESKPAYTLWRIGYGPIPRKFDGFLLFRTFERNDKAV